ncbi:helix-turn-helix transcriptional regulator [Pseudoflavitalea sp. G-6-1-2]|uniref:helix-turn-helix domain-containing protein n=1 Tax=Pseudoflavitalea sp. G-6-1-2 TaxID=2728841 RepID=UPI00146C4361|nr:AraC family transcriptional regulator [Pseudoflavitalea sp. G-6-1-2]NML24092.1 helix-turn-helix transcriptional regulator [Pseudoflavitalea sp. G-6-1-2]
MSIGQQILFFISILGAFNGLVLGFYLLFSKKNRSLPSLLLAALLLVTSIRIAKTVFASFNPGLPKIWLQIGLSGCFLIGPALFFFYRSVFNKVTKVPVSWKWVWAGLLAIIFVAGAIVPYQTYPVIWNKYFAKIIYAEWTLFVLATTWIMIPSIKKFLARGVVLNSSEKFLLLVFLGNFTIWFVYVVGLPKGLLGFCLAGALTLTLYLYITLIFYSSDKSVRNLLSGSEAEPPVKTEKRRIAEQDASIWMDKLEKAIHSKELYKDPNLKLNDLAQQINIPGHLLSQLLNDNLGKSFSTYINEFRIREACNLIVSNDRLTFEAIGYEVGYNSKSTFYTAFKKVTDTTPALFKESLENGNATTPVQS